MEFTWRKQNALKKYNNGSSSGGVVEPPHVVYANQPHGGYEHGYQRSMMDLRTPMDWMYTEASPTTTYSPIPM